MDEESTEVISRGTPANRWDIGTTMRCGGSLKANLNVNSFYTREFVPSDGHREWLPSSYGATDNRPLNATQHRRLFLSTIDHLRDVAPHK